jgi:RIO-like serine/threonine protein kinase
VVVAAHDGAFFDACILHRDISAGNIIITTEGEGLLIDWDLCVNLRNHEVAARRPKRTVRVFLQFFCYLLSFILRVHGNLCRRSFYLNLTRIKE